MRVHISYLDAFNICRKYIKAAAHITGGGLIDNIPRTLPPQYKAVISKNSWQKFNIFNEIQSYGNISEQEMYKVFNMGIGMTLIVDKNDALECAKSLRDAGHDCRIIGKIEKKNVDSVVLV
jgi:phosphoribosylformylglycinamidine cyclo-ligase